MKTLLKHRLLAALGLLWAACGSDPTETPSISDDFCHGQADGVRCNDGNPCTEGDVCGHGVCRGRDVPDNVVCDDGSLCTTLDYCEAGVCKGRAVDCSGTDVGVCEVAACDEGSGECAAVPAAVGSCDDGDPCTANDQCGAAGCAGSPLDCSGTAVDECQAAVCDPASGGCAIVAGPDGSSCGDASDRCTVGTCKGGLCHSEPKCAASGGPCRFGVCDALTGACSSVPKSDDLACEDGNGCTTGEVCAAGECVGGTLLEDGTLCQDGDPCHTVGICAAGACQAPEKDCSALDAPCRLGACDSATGQCVTEDKADGTPCDDGQTCTSDESCAAGACVALASACSCTGKADGTPCDDGDACTAADACSAGVCLGALKDCSAKDGPCTAGACVDGACTAVPAVDGTPCDDQDQCTSGDACVGGACDGTPKVCDAAPCTVAKCNPSSGACEVNPAFSGSLCDDADPCTWGDHCAGVSCVGSLEICGPCVGKAAGDACDDQNACTTGDQCALDGLSLVCTGAPKACDNAGLGACQLATCQPATGACAVAPAPPTALCSDGDPCTTDDLCDGAGACVGDEVDLCGATISGCGTAAVVNATPWTTLLWLDPEGSVDLSFSLSTGQAFSATTAAHCGQQVDTLLQLLDPKGGVVASADDNGAAFAALKGVMVETSGTFTLRVQGAFLTQRASVLLTLSAAPAVPCTTDASCGCADKRCQQVGANKVCTWAYPAASAGDAPLQLSVGDTARGHLQGGGSTVQFAVSLQKGEPVTVVTRGLCGNSLDTALTLRGPFGDVVGQSATGGQGEFAVLEAAIPPFAGEHVIEVSSPTSTPGSFVLEVHSGLCTQTSECICPDRACSGQPGAPGVCAPKLDVGEPTNGALPVLSVGDRIHSTLSSTEDVDEYAVSLKPGTYTVRVRGFCGAGTTASVALLPGAGPGVLASGTPDVTGYTVEAAGNYRVSVGGGVGDYTLLVEGAP